MKRIVARTEEQAVAIAAALPQYRAVRAVRIYHEWETAERVRFVIEVETYGAEEVAGGAL